MAVASQDGSPASKASLLTSGRELLRYFQTLLCRSLLSLFPSLPLPAPPPRSCLTHLYLGVTEVTAPLCSLSVPPSKDVITNKGIPFPACSNHHLPPSGEL